MRWVIDQAASQSSASSSISTRISSATAIAGWVSLSWIANLSGKSVEVGVPLLEAPDDVGDRAGDEEVLLLEAQRLALVALIVRVEDLRDVLGVDLLLDRAAEVALVEELQVEVARRARRPQAQRVRGVRSVADDERVVGQPDHVARVDPVARAAARRDRAGTRPARRSGRSARPRGAAAPRRCPAAASCRAARSGGRRRSSARTCRSRSGCRSRSRAARSVASESMKQAASRPEAAVAQPRIAFALEDRAQVEAVVRRQLDRRLVQVHVHQAEAEAAPGQELGRQVADALDVALDVRPLRRQPAVHQPIAHGVRERVIEVERGRVADLLGAGVHDVFDDGRAKIGVREAGAPTRARCARLVVDSVSSVRGARTETVMCA